MIDRAGRQAFVRLPFQLHRDHERWVPPLLRDERRQFDPNSDLAFRSCEVSLALAGRGHAVVGRIAGIISRRHNERFGERAARFGWLECPNDPAIAAALLGHVERWAAARGMDRIVGPMGFTDQDPEGFQVEGFEHEPTIATYSNFPYMAELLESNGYRKEVDYVVYKVPVPLRISKLDEAIAARALGRGGYRLLEFRTRRQLKPFVRPILEIMNETFEGLYGYVTLGREEMDELARKFWLFLDPRFVKVAVRGSLSVAFLIAVPNADPGFRRARGRLFPFGLLQIVAASRRSRQLDLLAAAVRREDRGRGLDAVGMAAILRSAIAAGFQVLDSHLELETNRLVRAEMERLGGVVCKRYRIFQRRIDGESDRS